MFNADVAQTSEDKLSMAASIRTYNPTPQTKKEAVTTLSPARTSSYALRQKSSPRRSLSPNMGRKPGTVSKRPERDASRPARPSPQRAQHAARDSSPAAEMQFGDLLSLDRAQHAGSVGFGSRRSVSPSQLDRTKQAS